MPYMSSEDTQGRGLPEVALSVWEKACLVTNYRVTAKEVLVEFLARGWRGMRAAQNGLCCLEARIVGSRRDWARIMVDSLIVRELTECGAARWTNSRHKYFVLGRVNRMPDWAAVIATQAMLGV